MADYDLAIMSHLINPECSDSGFRSRFESQYIASHNPRVGEDG